MIERQIADNDDREIFSSRLTYNSDTGDLRDRRSGKTVGTMHCHGYWRLTVKRKRAFAHRVAWLLSYGCWPREIDHINGDRLDNRLINLRECTRRENCQNKTHHRGNRLVGAARQKKAGLSNPWFARIYIDGKQKYLGHYGSELEAHKAYMDALYRYVERKSI